MNEKFYAAVAVKATHEKDPPNNLPPNCKPTLANIHAYAAKQLAGDSLITKVFICQVIEVVERASPPVTVRPAIERAQNNTGREWPAEGTEKSETSTAERDYSHG
jgi:hypothetical protein